MTQDINLLQGGRHPIRSAIAALAVLVVLLLGLLAYGAVLHRQASTLRREIASSATEMQQTKAALVALGEQSHAVGDTTILRSEVELLKARLTQARNWSALVDNPSLGSPTGYTQYFKTLARVPEDGLWLTSIVVGDSGKLLNLHGRALGSESVLRYAERLNQAFSAQGVQINAVELTPEFAVRNGQAGSSAMSSVSFRLY
jgi:hypothetical protein